VKKEVELSKAKWLVEPGCVVLVTFGTMENANVMTFSWQTPVNNADPCLIMLVINHIRYSYELIKQNHELVVNVPGEDLLQQVHYIGTVTGRKNDKFKKIGLTAVPAELVEPPLIKECPGHLECQVAHTFRGQMSEVRCQIICLLPFVFCPCYAAIPPSIAELLRRTGRRAAKQKIAMTLDNRYNSHIRL